MPQPALLAHDLVLSLGGRRVLDGVSLTASPGRRIGLIGENGVGKSTLLRVLAGVDEADSGTVTRPGDLGYLRQEMPFDADSTPAAVLDEALREAREDLTELDRLGEELARVAEDDASRHTLLDAYGKRLEQARDRESWDADRRAALMLAGLGLGALTPDRRLGTLSGGQRARLALATLLIRRPSALLLDEPTNHLDDDAAAFLEGQVRGLSGTVVTATHDRAFLDAVCTDLIDLDPALDGPIRYGGNYRAYLAEKHAERARWERRYAEEQEQLADLRRSAGVTAHRVAPDRGARAPGGEPMNAAAETPESASTARPVPPCRERSSGIGGGGRLLIREWGPRSGPTVIHHHGTPRSSAAVPGGWQGPNRAGVRVVAFDRPGCARSDGRPGRTVGDAARWTERVADACGIGRFAVMGVSGGGLHALAAAVLSGDRVDALCVSVGIGPVEAAGFDAADGMSPETVEEITPHTSERRS
ncbi:alpha/beta fold hydrolase [Embleya sp. NPDC059237]|uniref:alpha/beta fold hydrolase n=1 Tax=Embleya sp. NPDC059237 TaxID=3346784 RepID=UPI0036B80363